MKKGNFWGIETASVLGDQWILHSKLVRTTSQEEFLTKITFLPWYIFKLQVKMQGHFCFIKSPIFCLLARHWLERHLLYEKQSLLMRALFPTTFLVIYFVYDILGATFFPLYLVREVASPKNWDQIPKIGTNPKNWVKSQFLVHQVNRSMVQPHHLIQECRNMYSREQFSNIYVIFDCDQSC